MSCIEFLGRFRCLVVLSFQESTWGCSLLTLGRIASTWNSFCVCSSMPCVNIIIFLIFFFNSLLTSSTLSRMYSLSPRVFGFLNFPSLLYCWNTYIRYYLLCVNLCSYFCTFIAHESWSKCSKRTPNFTSL